MEIIEAINGATQILDEERQRPTISYQDIGNDWTLRINEMTPEEITAWKKIASVPRKNLWAQRQEYPRLVTETPQIYSFSGTNFDLLVAIYSQINAGDRPYLVKHVLKRVEFNNPFLTKNRTYIFPTMDGHVSELPLVAEFCIRTHNTEALFEATTKPKMPSLGLAIMMMHLEEILGLNFNLFSNEQLARMQKWLAALRETADRQTYSARGPRGGPMIENPHYKHGNERIANQIVKSIDGIFIECKQARYWYLKGALQQTINLEVESDKTKVESFLVKLGFSEQMVKALNAAENDYRSTDDPFELKSSLGHLRSFLEHLHRETASSVAAAVGDGVPDRWGNATTYLHKMELLTKQEEEFSTALYTLMSDGSVHPLAAKREHARLLRNVVIEYGVMFLSVLDKKGIKLHSKPQP
jgi:hypothetical protein